jgi:hypothetical protein
MNRPHTKSAGLLDLQMRSVPVVNRAVAQEPTEAGGLLLRAPLAHRGWSRLLRRVLPLSDTKNLELDPIGADVLRLCDGRNTVEDVVLRFADTWKLSFFESRAMILFVLKRLTKHGFLALAVPPRH